MLVPSDFENTEGSVVLGLRYFQMENPKVWKLLLAAVSISMIEGIYI